MAPSPILAVPCCENGRGGGHLTRCITLVKNLRALGREACLFLPKSVLTENILNLLRSMNFDPEWIDSNENFNTRNNEFIILDRFQTPKEELVQWKSAAPVIGIDEGGSSRGEFDFLIDILIPEKMSKSRANIASPALLINNLSTRRMEAQRGKLKLLITFGHEDAACLGLKTALFLSTLSEKYAMDITLLRGALTENKEQKTINNVKTIDYIPNLSERLHEYDLIITHYGITAYEALYAGTAVLLAHPSEYHKKLAKAAGFISFNEKIIKNFSAKAQKGKTAHIYKQCNPLLETSSRIKNNTSVTDLINSFSPQVNRQCPVCGLSLTVHGSLPSARFADRAYRRCKKCGIIYMDRTSPPPVEYAKEYFFESYKNQYGKTYLEDFDNIKSAAKLRLKRIIAILFSQGRKAANNSAPSRHCENSSPPPSLLDIGCAYGPFLAAAKEEGFSPIGIDPAEDAVRYVQQELGLPAMQGFFPDILVTPHSLTSSFDAVTLWFVIEHFKDCAAVLAEIKRILKPNGILAFSTPSFSGVSGRKSLFNFLFASPADHYTIWSPKMCGKALDLAGFKVKKIVSVGHHPERFPLLGKLAKSKKSPFYWMLLAISKLFKLGDTFEVYAYVKEINSPQTTQTNTNP